MDVTSLHRFCLFPMNTLFVVFHIIVPGSQRSEPVTMQCYSNYNLNDQPMVTEWACIIVMNGALFFSAIFKTFMHAISLEDLHRHCDRAKEQLPTASRVDIANVSPF